MESIIGIAIGGTKTAVVHAYFDGKNVSSINKVVFPTNPNSDTETIDLIVNEIKKLNYKVDQISIISGGPLDCKKGTINNPPHLPGFKGTKIVEIFQNIFKCKVTLINDADACALAEYRFGKVSNSTNMAYITFGTGYGSGLILNGKLYTGNNGMAGEIGHIQLTDNGPFGYGVEGSAEGYCAGGNIYKWANIKGISSTKDLFTLAKSGNEEALNVVNQVADKLGKSISILLDTLNLDTVVLGGIYPRNLDLLEEKVKNATKKYALFSNYEVCKILPSSLGEKIDDYSSFAGIFME